MYKFINFILWCFAFGALIPSYIFATFYMVQQDDFQNLEGTIDGEIKISKDEYGHDTGFRFQFKNDKLKYNLAGKLLERSDTDIYNLKAGDNVRVWIKKEAARSFVDNFNSKIQGIWGLEQINGKILLPLETAIAFRKSTKSLFYMSIFLIMSLLVFFAIYKRSQV